MTLSEKPNSQENIKDPFHAAIDRLNPSSTDTGGTQPNKLRAFEISTCKLPHKRCIASPLPSNEAPFCKAQTGTGSKRAGRPHIGLVTCLDALKRCEQQCRASDADWAGLQAAEIELDPIGATTSSVECVPL